MGRACQPVWSGGARRKFFHFWYSIFTSLSVLGKKPSSQVAQQEITLAALSFGVFFPYKVRNFFWWSQNLLELKLISKTEKYFAMFHSDLKSSVLFIVIYCWMCVLSSHFFSPRCSDVHLRRELWGLKAIFSWNQSRFSRWLPADFLPQKIIQIV